MTSYLVRTEPHGDEFVATTPGHPDLSRVAATPQEAYESLRSLLDDIEAGRA